MGSKKRKPPQPDADGVLDTGIIRRYVPPTASKHEALPSPPQEFQGSPSVEDAVSAAIDSLKPYLDGPLDSSPSEGQTAYYLDFGNGGQRFLLKDDAPPVCHDYMELLREWNLHQDFLSRPDDASQALARERILAIAMLLERIDHVRPHEHAAAVGKGYIDRINGVRPNSRDGDDLRREAEEALEKAQSEYSNRGKTYQTERAAESLGISRSQFYARLKM